MCPSSVGRTGATRDRGGGGSRGGGPGRGLHSKKTRIGAEDGDRGGESRVGIGEQDISWGPGQ